MRPTLFEWRGLRVPSYLAMLYSGLVLGIVAGNVAANARGMDSFRVYIAMCLLAVPALLGTRLLYVATHWSIYRRERALIWKKSGGGQAMYGGILVTLPLSIPLLRTLGIPFGEFWDAASFTILVGMILTRIGCFMHGCCSGRASSSVFSMILPNHIGVSERRIPTQLLEAAWALVILICIAVFPLRPPFSGALFAFTAGAYAFGRLIFESTREQNRARSGFTIHHAVSLLIIALSVAALTTRGTM